MVGTSILRVADISGPLVKSFSGVLGMLHPCLESQQSLDFKPYPFFRFKSIHSPSTHYCLLGVRHLLDTAMYSPAIKTADHSRVLWGTQGRGAGKAGVSRRSKAVRPQHKLFLPRHSHLQDHREARTSFGSPQHTPISVVSELQFTAGFSLHHS